MSEKTVHSLGTPHGLNTPHKNPYEVNLDLQNLGILSSQLYPTGRAWYGPENGIFENLHAAINLSFARLIKDSRLFLDSLFPDNPNFTSADATLWEYRLGLITNESLDLELRKSAIRRKLGHPNNVKARQSALFIEHQLQLAGFDVYIHENTQPYQTPGDIIAISLNSVQHGEPTQHGSGTQHGSDGYSVIANSIREIESYAVGSADNLWATFFIGGQVLGDMATVPYNRLKEFKELVIKLKPAHLVAFTFINYV
jgi:hypothetical protein